MLKKPSLKFRYLLSLIYVVFISVYALPSYAASDYERGVEAYQNQDFKRARNFWEDSAESGNLSAIFNLGIVLSKGIGGSADPERAVNLFRRAGDAGLAMGQHNLALAYYTGHGVQKDKQRAKTWWERAARQGHAAAQFNLGALLWNGDEVRKEANEAIKWFRLAAESGDVKAQAFLDTIFEKMSFDLAPEEVGGSEAITDPSLSSTLAYATQAYDAQDFEKAQILWQQAADKDSASAQYQLARLYQEGLGVEPNPQTAFDYFQASAKAGQAQAQYQLALYYLDGEIVTKNSTLALFWMQSAADNQHIKAKDYLEQLR